VKGIDIDRASKRIEPSATVSAKVADHPVARTK
jgi:hypothetical protein